MSTIFAVSSGRPPAAIAVIRISGPAAFETVQAMAGRLPPPRRAGLRRLRDVDGAVLDDALVLIFPGPASATGEDLAELHCHGGQAVVAAVERDLEGRPGVRVAEPGEFTRRALTNGRIDLAEAEGLADLLAAETEAQRIAALGAAEGHISRAVKAWMARIGVLAAEIEAALDFADEGDVGEDVDLPGRTVMAMEALGCEIERTLSVPPVDALRDGIRVVIAGPPNSGKSTLLNLMADREAAIVSPIAGTTRDRIEVSVSRGGLPFVLTDTAGLADETTDVIEAIGIEKANDAVARADLLVWLADFPPPRSDGLWVHSRSDLPGREGMPLGPLLAIRQDRWSSIETLWAAIERKAKELVPGPGQLAMDRRQRRLCAEAAEQLREPWNDVLIGAELLRRAHQSLGRLLGRNATEAMLDTLFSRFCLGK